MRPGQNKRLRGRNNNHGRKGPNPLTRSFESNGPDVKIRGTAQHIAEKYLQLARDAQSSGDPVMAESYLQHAEHYYRVITTAQQAQQQAMGLGAKPAQEADNEDDDGEDMVDDRFASMAERLPQPPQPQFQPNQNPGGQQPFQGGGAPQPYQNGGGQQPYQGDRQQQPYGDRQNRPWRDNRNNENRQDRPDRDRNRFESRGGGNNGEAPEQARGEERSERFSGNGGGQPWRNNENRRGPRPEQASFEPPQQDLGSALPAFITGSRAAPVADEVAPPPPVTEEAEFGGTPEVNEGQGYHLRPRRRRRGRPGMAAEGEFGETENVPSDESAPVSE